MKYSLRSQSLYVTIDDLVKSGLNLDELNNALLEDPDSGLMLKEDLVRVPIIRIVGDIGIVVGDSEVNHLNKTVSVFPHQFCDVCGGTGLVLMEVGGEPHMTDIMCRCVPQPKIPNGYKIKYCITALGEESFLYLPLVKSSTLLQE